MAPRTAPVALIPARDAWPYGVMVVQVGQPPLKCPSHRFHIIQVGLGDGRIGNLSLLDIPVYVHPVQFLGVPLLNDFLCQLLQWGSLLVCLLYDAPSFATGSIVGQRSPFLGQIRRSDDLDYRQRKPLPSSMALFMISDGRKIVSCKHVSSVDPHHDAFNQDFDRCGEQIEGGVWVVVSQCSRTLLQQRRSRSHRVNQLTRIFLRG